MSAIKILFVLAIIFVSAHAQGINVQVQAISTSLSAACGTGAMCTRPSTACADLTASIFAPGSCCPACTPTPAAVATKIVQFLLAHKAPCNESVYDALPACFDPTNVTVIAELTTNPLAFWPMLTVNGSCPTCKHPFAALYLERAALAVKPPCNRTNFQACMYSRPRCRAGEVPLPTVDSCCTWPCIPSETFCRIEDVVTCMKKQPDCAENDFPTFDDGECCPSCRPPPPACDPICGDDQTCVWIRQPPTDQTSKRQVIDSTRDPTTYSPTTTVPRAICRPRRFVRLILHGVAAALKTAGSTDPESVRILIVAAVRRWCLQGKMDMCGNGLLDVLQNIVVTDATDVTIGILVETHVSLHFSGLDANVEADILANVQQITQVVPAVTVINDAIVAFILKAVAGIIDEASELNVGLAAAAANPPFTISAVVFAEPTACRNFSLRNCNVSALPTCNHSLAISIDPSTCCPNCRRDVPRDQPVVCPNVIAVNCTRDLDLGVVENPRVDPVSGCFHCLPRPERTDTARCSSANLQVSFTDGPVCREWQIDPDRVDLVRVVTSVAIRGLPDTVSSLRCSGRCFHPLCKCDLMDRITCIRTQPDCVTGQVPEIADGTCCATCRITRPVCTPACTFPQICVRNRTDDTTSCQNAIRFKLTIALAAAIQAKIGVLTVVDVAEVIHHLIHSFDHFDIAERIDAIREKLYAIRDNVESYDSVSATASIYILVGDTPTGVKRQAQPNGGDVISDSCGQAQSDGTFSQCTLTQDNSTSTTAGTPSTTSGTPSTTSGTPSTTSGTPSTTSGTPSTTSGTPSTTSGTPSTTSGNPLPTSALPSNTSGSAPVGIAVALLLCFVASFLMTIM